MGQGDAAARAIALFLLGGVFFVALNSIAKALTPSLGPVMVIWGRFFFHILLAAMLFPGAMPRLFRAHQLGFQLGRSVLLMLSTVCNFLALAYLPLGDVSAIVFTAPIMVAAMAVFWLGERVSPARWMAILAGLAGAVMVIRPGWGTVGPGALLAVGCALAYAFYQVSTRIVREGDPIVSLLFAGLGGLLLFSALAPFAWRPPTLWEWALLAILGASGAVGHLLVILALRRLEASRLTPFTYIQLVWAMVASFVVFGDVPSGWTLLGGTVIVGSGLFIWWLTIRERAAVPVTSQT
jgi:drug/metabolite transporter (DMT)-like permease